MTEPFEPPPPRARRLERLESESPDVVVVGGGVTGAGIALDLSLRGVRVLLVERGDWAAATSSASSRLIHGGLRYLEQYEFGLVRESCRERALLLRNAAGLVWPERFAFPVRRGDRVGLLRLAAGLTLYTAVSLPRALGLPRVIGRREVARRIRGVATDGLRGAGVYLDAATDDARLTLAVVLAAMDAGAICLSRVEALGIEAGSKAAVELRDLLGSGGTSTVEARAAVLAGGPFVDGLRARAGLAGGWIAPTRGTHVAVPRERLSTDGAVIFPSPVDGRVMFLIPWPRYTVVGTTDLDASPEDEIRATRADVRYLLDSANGLAPGAALTEDDVVSTWAGLRPLLAAPGRDPSQRSREERIQRDGPVYTIAGGKLTAFRSMAEKIGARVTDELGIGRRGAISPTRDHLLPGALPERAPRPSWSSLGPDGKPELGREPILHAWARRYGARQELVEDACMRAQEGLRSLDAETLLGEVDWAVRREDCLRPSDFFLRRTDLGLGPRAIADEAAPLVIERMRDLFGWNADEVGAARDELKEALDRGQRWRKD